MNPHSINARVYFEDTDAGAVAYHTTYLRYMERGRTEWLRANGWTLAQVQQLGVVLVVRNIEAEFLSAAILEDVVEIITEYASHTRTRVYFNQAVHIHPRAALVDAIKGTNPTHHDSNLSPTNINQAAHRHPHAALAESATSANPTHHDSNPNPTNIATVNTIDSQDSLPGTVSTSVPPTTTNSTTSHRGSPTTTTTNSTTSPTPTTTGATASPTASSRSAATPACLARVCCACKQLDAPRAKAIPATLLQVFAQYARQ